MASIDTIADRSTGSAIAGKAYFETSTNKFIVYNGSSWIELDSDGVGAVYQNRWGASFDGTNDYINLTSPLVATGAYTLSMWFKQTKDALGILAYGATKYIEPSGSTGRVLFSGYGGINTAVGSYTFGDWTHLMLARDSSNSVQVWLNGISAGTGSHIGNATFDRFGIYASSVQPFGGEIDDIAYWDSDQTSNLSAIYNGGVPTDLSSLTPTGYWRMGDDSSDTATSGGSIATITDSSGNGNDAVQATASSQPTFKALDSSTTSLSFDGSDDYVDLGTSSSLNPSSALTISAWIYINGVGTGSLSTIYSSSKSSDQISGGIALAYTSSKIRFYLDRTGSSSWVLAESNSTLSTGQWYHLAGTWDGSTVTLYVDGTAQSSTVNASTIGYNTDFPATIGRYSSNYFNGLIDEVALFDSALSASGVASLAASRGAHIVNDLSLTPVAYYRMGEDDSLTDGASAAQISDASGNGNHATQATAANQPTASVDPVIYV